MISAFQQRPECFRLDFFTEKVSTVLFLSTLVTRLVASDQAEFCCSHDRVCRYYALGALPRGALALRALTCTNCFDLECFDWQTPILVILNSRTAFISGIQEVQGGFLMRPFSAYKAKKPLHTGLRTGCHYLISLCPSVCLSVCVTFVVFTDCENYTRPISTNSGSMEAGEYGLTRGT